MFTSIFTSMSTSMFTSMMSTITLLTPRNGCADKARLLLENGVEVAETQRQGWNSLHLAVR